MGKKHLIGETLKLTDGGGSAVMTRAQFQAILALAFDQPPQIFSGYFPGELQVTSTGFEISFEVGGADGREWDLSFAKVTGVFGATASGTSTIRIADVPVGDTPTKSLDVNISASASGGQDSVDGGSYTVLSGDVIYVYVTAASGHSDLQFQIQLEAVE